MDKETRNPDRVPNAAADAGTSGGGLFARAETATPDPIGGFDCKPKTVVDPDKLPVDLDEEQWNGIGCCRGVGPRLDVLRTNGKPGIIRHTPYEFEITGGTDMHGGNDL